MWQPSLFNKTESDFGIPTDIANHLLSAYFHWQNPFHNFVYKPCKSEFMHCLERLSSHSCTMRKNTQQSLTTGIVFVRDLAVVGPYCSRFLLTSIFALAARHCSHDSVVYRDRGERFLAAAKELLVGELSSSRPAITTIQGLLILGCRQCSTGNTSEGWLFSGMVSLTVSPLD